MGEQQLSDARRLLERLPRAVQERLSHIDFTLYFLGELKRADVTSRFGTAPAGATRDIAQYKELMPNNLTLDGSSKTYRPTASFAPLFQHDVRRVLTALSQGFGDGIAGQTLPMVKSEQPIALSVPKLHVLAPISRALYRGKAARIRYVSVDSGESEREIVPEALVFNSVRWHVRAFDRNKQDFRDFNLTRIKEAVELEDSPILQTEKAEADVQWSRLIELELVPHPLHPRPEVVRLDYNIPEDEDVLRVRVRAVHAGYLLRLWSVDCSPDHHLKGLEYALWLRDPLALYGSSSANLAPGYADPRALPAASQS